MTFQEAQAVAKEYEPIIGMRAINSTSTIVAIVIEKDGDNHYPCAFYYTGGSQVGKDPVEVYKNICPSTTEKRAFRIYEEGRLPYGFLSAGNVIINSSEVWMIGKTLQEIKPYLLERKAQAVENK